MIRRENDDLTVHALNGVVGGFERGVVHETVALADICFRITSNLRMRKAHAEPLLAHKQAVRRR